MKLLQENPYPTGRSPLYKKLIRGLFYKFVDEMYIPSDAEMVMTYRGGDGRGIKLAYRHQESYFDIPRDILKDTLKNR